MEPTQTVAILGASNKPDRYSHMLLVRLKRRGITPLPIHPTIKNIEGFQVYPRLEDLPPGVDVLSMYVNSSRSDTLYDSILKADVKRVIFNPGSENFRLIADLKAKGVEAFAACSLILLDTGGL